MTIIKSASSAAPQGSQGLHAEANAPIQRQRSGDATLLPHHDLLQPRRQSQAQGTLVPRASSAGRQGFAPTKTPTAENTCTGEATEDPGSGARGGVAEEFINPWGKAGPVPTRSGEATKDPGSGAQGGAEEEFVNPWGKAGSVRELVMSIINPSSSANHPNVQGSHVETRPPPRGQQALPDTPQGPQTVPIGDPNIHETQERHTMESLPSLSDADAVFKYAMSFNAYVAYGSFDAAEAIARSAPRSNLKEVRAELFFKARASKHADNNKYLETYKQLLPLLEYFSKAPPA